MIFRLRRMALQFRQSREEIDLDHHVVIFHGKISSGKSTIARMIDACLGGKLPVVPAFRQEFVAAELHAAIGVNEVIFERIAGSNQVQVTWINSDGEGASVLAPIDNSETPIWGTNVFGLSDLIFELAGIGPMRVRKNKSDPDAPLIPLSFRDLMWYCYLDQDELDSTFFHLESEDPRSPKSRDVMRFVLGYYTEHLNVLEQQLAREVENNRTKLESAKRMRAFLAELGYGSALEMGARLAELESEQDRRTRALSDLQVSHEAATHFTDDLRHQLRALSATIAAEESALSDGTRLLEQETALRAEIISAKFRLNRLSSATMLLGSVDYKACPRCGTHLADLSREATDCLLCGAPEQAQRNEERRSVSAQQPDLDSRLADIEQSISARKKLIRKGALRLAELKERKAYLDSELSRQMRDYDSAFLSQVRNLEREIASGRQELIGLRRDSRLPDALQELETEADGHLVKAQSLRREIRDERAKLADRDNLVGALEAYVFDALFAVGFPALRVGDELRINRRNWMAYILPAGDESLAYTLSGAGSGGKKTLFNICYAIALHRLVEELNLPLPKFVIIDSPMKNIGTEVNKDIFVAFYNYVYHLLTTSMSETQLVIIDTELSAPTVPLDFTERLMIAGDAAHPPLIPYYSGH
jgi:hypothetical protein